MATKDKIWHISSLGDEAKTSNTCIVQRMHALPHSTMKTNGNIIECCNSTHQGAPHYGKQTCACASDLGDASHVTCLCARIFVREFLLAQFRDVCLDLMNVLLVIRGGSRSLR